MNDSILAFLARHPDWTITIRVTYEEDDYAPTYHLKMMPPGWVTQGVESTFQDVSSIRTRLDNMRAACLRKNDLLADMQAW